jgi:SSS family solute:Na+ symporter
MGKHLLTPLFYGVLLAGVVAIIMSSQESLMNSASVALVRDIIGLRGKLSDHTELILGRLATIAIAVLAVVVAQYSPSIIEGLLICYSIWAPGLLFPFLLGLYLKRTKPMAGWLSMLAGAITSIVWQTVLKEPGAVPSILVGLAASGIGYVIGHFAGPESSVREGEPS